MTVATTNPLSYYAAHGCALFPIPAGSKAPGPASFWSVDGGATAASFKKDCSADPEQWKAWASQHPGCNFGVVAFASRFIIVDIDTSGDRNEAWALWCELCASWGINVAMPHISSARGGWHVLFAVPADVDASKLRQPDAIKKRINVRCIGYVVAAGSYYDGTAKGEESGYYTLLSDAAPYPAPVALVEHCTRRAADPLKSGAVPGSRDKGDTAALIDWLNEREMFDAYEDWVSVGMALKLEFGDDAFEIWELTFDTNPSTPDLARSKWDSFSTEPDAGSVTLNTYLAKAHQLGWRGSVRKSASAMFDSVAHLAAAAGAQMASGLPVPPMPHGQGIPMMAGQEELARLGAPYISDFLAATISAPISPLATDLPALPDAMSGHSLFASMQSAITRVFALAEQPKFKPAAIINPLAVLHEMHPDIYGLVTRRLENMGVRVQHNRIKQVATKLQEDVQRVTVTIEKWEHDAKSGNIQSDNPDNIKFGLEYLGLDLCWNAWLERMQIKGGTDPDCRWNDWTPVDDAIVASLLTRWGQTKTRFCPGVEFTWRTLLAFAHRNTVDPVLDHLAALESKWDGAPRLDTWLIDFAHVEDTPLHRAIGTLIVGGMVKRARVPGVKFDFMPIFYGPQGTGKSTMAEMLARRPEWFTDNVMLGDDSKELILSMAGKLIVEIGEMGSRSSANSASIKAMISRRTDRGRTAYARTISERDRRNIFIGTTNDETPLSDPSGNRRFLGVPITKAVDLAGFAVNVDQIIGEAAARITKGENLHELSPNIWAAAAEAQESIRQPSDLEIKVQDWFAETEFTGSAYVMVSDLVDMCHLTGMRNASAASQPLMKALGFRQERPRIDGKQMRVWVRSILCGEKHIREMPRYQADLVNRRFVVRGQPIKPGAGMPPPPPMPSR